MNTNLVAMREKIPIRDNPDYDAIGRSFINLLKIEGDTTYWMVGAHKLGKMGYGPAREQLTALLKAEDGMYRDAVQRKLSGTNGARAEAAIALGYLEGDDVANELRKIIYNPNSIKTPCILEGAIFGLGLARGEDAVEELIGLLSSETWFIRADAVKALGRIGNEKAYKAIEILQDDEIGNVRICVKKALDSVGGKV